MKYRVVIEKDEDDYFTISCPALPGCHSQGKTREEALQNIKEAISACIESRIAHGEPIPEEAEVEVAFQP